MSNDDVIFTHLTRNELLELVKKQTTWLDNHEPNWRNNLATCCLTCSYIPWGNPMTTLDTLYNNWWMLHPGTTYLDFVNGHRQPCR